MFSKPWGKLMPLVPTWTVLNLRFCAAWATSMRLPCCQSKGSPPPMTTERTPIVLRCSNRVIAWGKVMASKLSSVTQKVQCMLQAGCMKMTATVGAVCWLGWLVMFTLVGFRFWALGFRLWELG